MTQVSSDLEIVAVRASMEADSRGDHTGRGATLLFNRHRDRTTFRRHLLSGTRASSWGRYVGQYRGMRDYDYGPILSILREDFGFEELPSAGRGADAFRSETAKYVLSRRARDLKRDPEELDYKAEDKCRRDGVLLADIKVSRDYARGIGHRKPVILSSSRYMRQAARKFSRELGRPDGVLMPGALGCLLTLIPGVRLGVRALRGVLSDTRIAAKMTSVEGYAYRLIVLSGEYDVPWSRRGTLRRELGERFLEDAKATGQPRKAVRDRVLGSQDPAYSAKMVSDALKAMAVPPESAKEMEALRGEIVRLRAELRAKKYTLATRARPAK